MAKTRAGDVFDRAVFIDYRADSACGFACEWCAALVAFGLYEFSAVRDDEIGGVYLCGGLLRAQKPRSARVQQRRVADDRGAWLGVDSVAAGAGHGRVDGDRGDYHGCDFLGRCEF
mgnify:CR=1 FL=1